METNIPAKDMIDYLQQVADIECSYYSQCKARDVAREKIESLIVPSKKYIPVPVNKNQNIAYPEEPVLLGTNYGAVIGKLIAGIAAIALGIFAFSFKEGFPFFCGILLILGGIFICLGGWAKKSLNDKANDAKKAKYVQSISEYETNKKNYEKEIAKYQEEAHKAEEIFQKETEDFNLRKDTALKAIGQMEEPLKQTEEVLNNLYSLDWIFPKYRNMVAICSIYEYFASGRVYSLEGPDGAYNLYESELRQNIIINKLDKIINQLDQIKENQYTLYLKISEMNKNVENIANDISQILSYTGKIYDTTQAIAKAANITASCSDAIAKNTRALEYLTLITR